MQLGAELTVGVDNGLILGYLMCRFGLVPRGMAVLGLVGGLGIRASGAAVLIVVASQILLKPGAPLAHSL
uniref:Uncharacterized protein n=1 Tax=uncultured Nocardioidaceae bacterium TaxID=253824 RepID=A0A6J4KN10_9ACTN|nr:MAG: hypothetical protein AVDCRST_MAG46-119 [uncultured Nocardioidaceae bacterium]